VASGSFPGEGQPAASVGQGNGQQLQQLAELLAALKAQQPQQPRGTCCSDGKESWGYSRNKFRKTGLSARSSMAIPATNSEKRAYRLALQWHTTISSIWSLDLKLVDDQVLSIATPPKQPNPASVTRSVTLHYGWLWCWREIDPGMTIPAR
jgi:hypothetical protein